MFRTFLSLRYLRARKTSWIGIAGIFVAVAALVMILSIMAGFLAETRRSVRGNLADLVIQPSVLSQVRLANGDRIPAKKDADGLVALVKAHPKVVGATPQLHWYALFIPDNAGSILERPMDASIELVEIVGIDFETEGQASTFDASLVEEYLKKPTIGAECTVGRVEDPKDPFAPLPPRAGADQRRDRPGRPIIVGEALAYRWQLERGANVSLFSVTLDDKGEPNEQPLNDRFQVVGSFRSKDNEMDGRRIYIDRQDLHDWLRQAAWSTVIVKLDDYERDKMEAQSDLALALHEAGYLANGDIKYSREIRTWEDFRSQLLRAIGNEKKLMAVMLSLVLVVACFTVFALLSMMVTEKRRDIGILCALGATSRGVLALFLMIGLWEAVIGSALGALVGTLGALYIDRIEKGLSSAFGFQIFDREVYLFDHIPSEVTPGAVAIIVAGAVFFTLLFAAIPAWRASRLDPVEALRHE